MSTAETEIPDACAACGKAGDGLKRCTSCQQVKYCGRDCQSSDWKAHKRVCKKRAAELHEEVLFRQPPPRDDCPICFLMLPADVNDMHYQACCGQTVCDGCMFTVTVIERMCVCPFCRGARSGGDEGGGEYGQVDAEKFIIEQYKKRVEANDAGAMASLGIFCIEGRGGVARDPAKAIELWEQAGKLGNAQAYTSLAQTYLDGDGVARDMKKTKHYWELAAMAGEVGARHNLGLFEMQSNNPSRAVKHFAIAARDGHERAMKDVTAMKQLISRQEYEETLRAFVKVTKEIKSEQRDKAKEFHACAGSGIPEVELGTGIERVARAEQWVRANGLR